MGQRLDEIIPAENAHDVSAGDYREVLLRTGEQFMNGRLQRIFRLQRAETCHHRILDVQSANEGSGFNGLSFGLSAEINKDRDENEHWIAEEARDTEEDGHTLADARR